MSLNLDCLEFKSKWELKKKTSIMDFKKEKSYCEKEKDILTAEGREFGEEFFLMGGILSP